MKLTIILAVLASAVPALAACSKYGSVALTFYGYPDNDPPGPGKHTFSLEYLSYPAIS